MVAGSRRELRRVEGGRWGVTKRIRKVWGMVGVFTACIVVLAS